MIFESVERSVAQHMQNWISEEFAYISSKREQGISDPNEELRVRCELQLPEFNGRNPEDWVLQLEDSFQFFQLNEETKLKAAIIGLAGKALRWYEEEHRWLPFRKWHELKVQLSRHFYSASVQSGSWSSHEKPQKNRGVLDPVQSGSASAGGVGLGGGCGGSENLAAKLDSGDKGLAREYKFGGRHGDFSDGFTGGGDESSGGGETRKVGVFVGTAGRTDTDIVDDGAITGSSEKAGVFYGGGSEVFLEWGGANNSVSGCGPGVLAGKVECGDKTTTSGGLSKGGGFMKGGSEASGSGGGPGCWFTREKGSGGCRCGVDRGGFKQQKCGDFASGFSGGGCLVSDGCSVRGELGLVEGVETKVGDTQEWWWWWCCCSLGGVWNDQERVIREGEVLSHYFGLENKEILEGAFKGIIVIQHEYITKELSHVTHVLAPQSRVTKEMLDNLIKMSAPINLQPNSFYENNLHYGLSKLRPTSPISALKNKLTTIFKCHSSNLKPTEPSFCKSTLKTHLSLVTVTFLANVVSPIPSKTSSHFFSQGSDHNIHSKFPNSWSTNPKSTKSNLTQKSTLSHDKLGYHSSLSILRLQKGALTFNNEQQVSQQPSLSFGLSKSRNMVHYCRSRELRADYNPP